MKLQRRFSKGLTYLTSYTWSRSIDYGSAIRVHKTDLLFPQSGYDLRAERGLSSFNVPHRSVTSVLYELPFGKGRRFISQSGAADAVLGGMGARFDFHAPERIPGDRPCRQRPVEHGHRL